MLLKGKVTDLAPSVQVDTIPDDGKDYYLVVRDAVDVTFTNVYSYKFNDKMPEKFVGNCDNVVFN